ncbi:HD-GYP domain-containing protein [Streptomyces sp. NPDC018833]|uniref:HD-GYP domain-containing protein n=1 Tax=Streptomyces sp. NPDC018833 TaxID=3365053 RepID=UPI00379A1365
MTAIPKAANAFIAGAVVSAAVCVAPAVTAPGAGWTAVALLAGLYAACEMPARFRPGNSVPIGAGSFFPVLLAAAFLLPAPAAALVPVPGALLGPAGRPSPGARRAWHAAQLALSTWAAAQAYRLTGGERSLTAPDFPHVLVPALAGALAFWLVLGALDGGIRTTAEHLPPRRAGRALLPASPAPYCVHGLAGLMMAVLWRSSYGAVSALVVLLPMYVSSWMFAQYHRERAAHQATIRALVQAVDIKDRYTRGHSERVGRASVLIARELRMADERLELLRFAGILHDVGKLGVPTRVLRKEGPLTPDERRMIELHPEYGHEIVRSIGFLGEARAAILHHHERLDGSGYPYGLAGDRIPEFARVVAVADAFDAMTSTRSYRRARPVAAALEELERCAGTQFDPRMVTALARALEREGWETAVTSDEAAPANPAAPADSASHEGPAGPAVSPVPAREEGPRAPRRVRTG